MVGVVTNPDKPAGRGLALRPSPVKARAVDLGLVVQDPPTAKDPALQAWVADLALDVAVVVAYGKILPRSLLSIPEHGFVNLHFSLLPEYRGAAPVQRAVMDGRSETGISIMVLTEGMDEGPVIAAQGLAIDPHESAGRLGERLAELGAQMLPDALRGYVSEQIRPEPQNDLKGTYADKISDEDARIDWGRTFASIDALVRGMDPNPGAWTTLRGKRLKVFRVEAADDITVRPGELVPGPELVVGTGDRAARLVEVQAAGKRRMPGTDLARGLRVVPGESLGEGGA